MSDGQVVPGDEGHDVLLGVVYFDPVPFEEVEQEHTEVRAFQCDFLVGLNWGFTFSYKWLILF